MFSDIQEILLRPWETRGPCFFSSTDPTLATPLQAMPLGLRAGGGPWAVVAVLGKPRVELGGKEPVHEGAYGWRKSWGLCLNCVWLFTESMFVRLTHPGINGIPLRGWIRVREGVRLRWGGARKDCKSWCVWPSVCPCCLSLPCSHRVLEKNSWDPRGPSVL